MRLRSHIARKALSRLFVKLCASHRGLPDIRFRSPRRISDSRPRSPVRRRQIPAYSEGDPATHFFIIRLGYIKVNVARFGKEGRVVYYSLAPSFPHPLLEHCLRQLLTVAVPEDERIFDPK